MAVRAIELTLVRSLWQACWLDAHWVDQGSSKGCLLGKLEKSLFELDTSFDDFIMKMKMFGWDDHAITIKKENI